MEARSLYPFIGDLNSSGIGGGGLAIGVWSDSSKKPGNTGRYAAAESAIIPKPISSIELLSSDGIRFQHMLENIPDSYWYTVGEEIIRRG
jgi:hypothetical protein